MRFFIHPVQIIREHDETDFEYILFSDETGLTHPIAVLVRPELQGLVDAAESALGVVEERLLNAKTIRERHCFYSTSRFMVDLQTKTRKP